MRCAKQVLTENMLGVKVPYVPWLGRHLRQMAPAVDLSDKGKLTRLYVHHSSGLGNADNSMLLSLFSSFSYFISNFSPRSSG